MRRKPFDPSNLPAPNSDEAKAMYEAACAEVSRLDREDRCGWPELQRDAVTWWCRQSLRVALETGEITPTAYARLYPLAAEREHRMEGVTIAANVSALYALAFADEYPLPPEEPEVGSLASGGEFIEDGSVYFEDAAGKIHKRPVASWIGFAAQRLHSLASQEFNRRFNAESRDLDEVARRDLDARLRRELRMDAIFALTFHPERAFQAGQADRGWVSAGKVAADAVDLKRLDMAALINLYDSFSGARELWEGIMVKPFCIKQHGGDWVLRSPAGELAEFEDERAGFLMDRIVEEIRTRTPRDDEERNSVLSLRIRHEIACEGRIRDDVLMADMAKAWA
ncbi:hypothetical protein [Methylobacterium oxalidis]|uniref:hypothetical protein n=1 Tax=Methylobacterium oxalidis TaxID=944322 RepID=UPI003314C084